MDVDRQQVPYAEEYIDRKYRQEEGGGRSYQNPDITANGTRRSSGVPWRGCDPATKGLP